MGLFLSRAAELFLNELIPGRVVIIQDGWKILWESALAWLGFKHRAVILKGAFGDSPPSCSPWV